MYTLTKDLSNPNFITINKILNSITEGRDGTEPIYTFNKDNTFPLVNIYSKGGYFTVNENETKLYYLDMFTNNIQAYNIPTTPTWVPTMFYLDKYVLNSTQNPLTFINYVAWNNKIWVAVGSGFASSSDGIKWAQGTSNVPVSNVSSVTWNSRMWIATATDPSYMFYSNDGNNWIGQPSVFSTTSIVCSRIVIPFAITDTPGTSGTTGSTGLTGLPMLNKATTEYTITAKGALLSQISSNTNLLQFTKNTTGGMPKTSGGLLSGTFYCIQNPAGKPPIIVEIDINVIVSIASTDTNISSMGLQCIGFSGVSYIRTFDVSSVYGLVLKAVNVTYRLPSYGKWTSLGAVVATVGSNNQYVISGKATFKMPADTLFCVAINHSNASWTVVGGNITVNELPFQTGGSSLLVNMNPKPRPAKSFIRKSSIHLKRGRSSQKPKTKKYKPRQ